MAEIKFKSGETIRANEEYKIIDLEIDGTLFEGETKIDSSSDLGKAVLNYLIANPELTKDFTSKESSYESETLTEQIRRKDILNLKSKLIDLFDEVVTSRGYVNSYDCLSFLFSKNEAQKKEATNYNEWRDNCLSIFDEQAFKYLNGMITADEFSEDVIWPTLPTLFWDQKAKDEADNLDKENARKNELRVLTLEDKKAEKIKELNNYINELFAFTNSNVYVTSSVRGLTFNSDCRSYMILNMLYNKLKKETDTTRVKVYDNSEVHLTKEEIGTLISEVAFNITNILGTKWVIEKQIQACNSKEDVDLVKIHVTMLTF